MEPPSEEHDLINTQLSLIKNKIHQAFLILQIGVKSFTVDDIYLQYKGENIKTEKTLLEVFKMHNERMFTLVEIDYSKSTYSKFIEAKNHVKNFIKLTYKKSDFMLSNLNMKFLNDFDFYLKSEKNHKQITINKTIQRLRKIIKLAMAEGFILTDPFLLYRPKKYVTKVVFLSVDELENMKSYNFRQLRLQQVKDMFIFCCYTGLPYAEMRDLRKKHIVVGFDGNKWIEMYRQKTSKELNIPLLTEAIKILEKYDFELPVITNQKFNSYLKEIADILGIEKRITHHTARKTFASTVLLFNDVPMERQREGIAIAKAKGTYKGRVRGTVESDDVVLRKYKSVVKNLNAGYSLRVTKKLSDVSLGTVQKVKSIMIRNNKIKTQYHVNT